MMNFLINSVVSGALIISLCGCQSAPDVNKETGDQIAAASKIEFDHFRKTVSINGQPIQFTRTGWQGGLDDGAFWLSAIKSEKTGDKAFALLFKTVRSEWAFWDRAFDSDGNNLPVRRVISDVGSGGVVYETISVELGLPYLKTHPGGILIRVDGKGVKQEINVPPHYIKAFLAKASTVGID